MCRSQLEKTLFCTFNIVCKFPFSVMKSSEKNPFGNENIWSFFFTSSGFNYGKIFVRFFQI